MHDLRGYALRPLVVGPSDHRLYPASTILHSASRGVLRRKQMHFPMAGPGRIDISDVCANI